MFRFQEIAKYLVLEMDADVQSQCQLPLEVTAFGTALTLAVANEDLEMAKLLLEDLGANVNERITLVGNVSSHVHLALERMSRYVCLIQS